MASPLIKAHFFLYLAQICLIILPTTALASALPGCPDKCGTTTIPYPFGTLPGCFREGFNITCNNSTTPPKPFLVESETNIDLLDINITSAEARVLNYIGYDCYNETNGNNVNYTNPSIDITSLKPFLFSNRRNKFTAIGCYTLAYISGNQTNIITRQNYKSDSYNEFGQNYNYSSGCASFCDSLNRTTGDGGSCDGLGCCQTSIPEGLNYYMVLWPFSQNDAWSFNPCSYAMLVQEDWYNFTIQDLQGFLSFYERNNEFVPIVLDWAIRDNGTCQDGVENSTNPACLSQHSRCNNTANGEGYICNCLPGYEGNPYLHNGCTDINECEYKDACMDGTCKNTEGNYTCACPKGTRGDGKIENCTAKFSYPARVATACILGVAVLLGVCFLLIWYQQHKRHMKEKEEYNRYYQMMDNHLRVFSEKQVENATDNYNDALVLGRGGQGNVYKGLLENNQVVAIKKAKEVEGTQIAEFVNEIILLSQINHKNVVKLLGCCLEAKIPMLVSEFVANGTLFDLLHRKSNRRSISLSTRLKIALDSAVALDHLHSSLFRTIIHGDVKSANILLDADYTAKVSDFGASSVVTVNENVQIVHFTHGYLDPECLYTQIITKNSDIYSFGVVMLELLTRKEAVYIDEKGEKQSLATSFLWKARKNEQREMLDVEIVTNEENVMEVLDEISEIALQCLSPKGEDRPTMRQVVEELQKLVRLVRNYRSCGGITEVGEELSGQQIDQQEMESLLGESQFYSVSEASGINSSIVPNIMRRWKSTPEHQGDVD